jgi:AAA domain
MGAPPGEDAVAMYIDPETRRILEGGGLLNSNGRAPDGDDHETNRRLVLTMASQIRPARVHWLWEGRLAIGTLALLAGREGIGKSLIAYWLAAMITKGTLPGEYCQQPRAVIVAASEDSWAYTIVPRLIAARANLDLVYRIEVITDDVHSEITMPNDLHELERVAAETGARLLILDPLMSRLSDRLDTHRDAEVRRALEPMAAVADRARVAVLGIIHHNKSGSTDALQLVMGSKAFTAVARSVHTVLIDPDDETDTRRLFGTPKNNLGKTDLPTLAFTIASHAVQTDDGVAWTGRVEWGDEHPTSIGEAIRTAAASADDRSATTEAARWLDDYLESKGGNAPSADIKSAGKKAGHSEDALKRARKRLKLHISESGFPRITHWHCSTESKLIAQSEQQSEQIPRGDTPTALTAPTEGQNTQSEQKSPVGAVGVGAPPRAHDTLSLEEPAQPRPSDPT